VMICEMLGTALFLYGIIMTGTAQTIPFSLFASILLFGAITGGHFNPAVSLGVYIGEGKDYGENFVFLLLIWLGQFLGGFLAMGLAYLSLYESKPRETTVPGDLVPRLCPQQYPMIDDMPDCDNWDGVKGFAFDWQVLVNEMVCTFIFVSVILMVKLDNKYVQVTKDGISGAIAVALTLLAMI
jgi:glycerol uptake facilitator-like aquaporin